MIELNKIYNEDCLEGMKRIPNGSVDCIICDLPYGVLNKQNEGGGWDSIIPFEPLWEEYLRITKPNAAIILFGQGMFTAKLMMSNEKMWRYNLTWDKKRTTGFLNAKKMPLKQTEIISVFYKEFPTYHPQMRKCLPHERNHSRGKLQGEQTNRCYGNFGKAEGVISDEKYPTDIIEFARNVHTSFHPVQKPVELIQYLIRTYSNEGDTILDNCMGSGTTAVAAWREKRNFIGFELNKEYYDKACKRIQLEFMQPTLF